MQLDTTGGMPQVGGSKARVTSILALRSRVSMASLAGGPVSTTTFEPAFFWLIRSVASQFPRAPCIAYEATLIVVPGPFGSVVMRVWTGSSAAVGVGSFTG